MKNILNKCVVAAAGTLSLASLPTLAQTVDETSVVVPPAAEEAAAADRTEDAQTEGAQSAQPGTIVLAPVTLRANQTQSEYTAETNIGRVYTDPKELPQTIDSVTAKQIEDRNFRSSADLYKATPSATVNSTEGRVEVRGYSTEETIDGLEAGGFVGRTDADLSPFENVEILKGPATTFSGAGGFGGRINYTFKRPLPDQSSEIQLGFGHPSAKSILLDYNTGSMLGGKLRGRLVGSYEDRDLFTYPEYYKRTSIYGVVEYDLTPTTTFHLNAWQQKNISGQGFRIGLPTYTDGSLIDFDQGTSVSQTWNKFTFHSVWLMAGFSQQLGDRWKVTGDYRYGRSWHPSKYASTFVRCEGPNLVPGYGDGIDKANPDGRRCYGIEYYDDRNTTEVQDVTLTGSFDALNQTHDVVAGVTKKRTWFRRTLGSGRDEDEFVVDVFDPDHDVLGYSPSVTHGGVPDKGPANRQIDAFAQVTFRASDTLRFPVGGRLTWFRTADGVTSAEGKFTPSLGAVYDVTPNVTVYGQYAKMFEGNSGDYGWRPEWTDNVARDPREGVLLPNVTGTQYEVGLKAQVFDSVLATASIFQIEENNRPRTDPDPAHASSADRDEFQIATGETRSRGFETTFTGEVRPGWNVSLSYAYLDAKLTKDDEAQGAQKQGVARHSANLWTDYTIQSGRFEGLAVGGGLRLKSKFKGSETDSEDTDRVHGPGYGVVSARVAYPVYDNAELSMNIDNLFDKTYYEILGDRGEGNYHGEGRRFSVNLTSRF